MNQDALMAREALDLRLRLEFGLASLEEVELWADAWLMAFETPRDELVDLALAGRMGTNTSFTLLRQLNPTEPKPEDVLRAVGRFAETDLLPQQLENLARHLEFQALPAADIEDTPAGRLLLEAFSLVDAFDLAESGQSGTVREACDRTRRFLGEARKFSVARGAE